MKLALLRDQPDTICTLGTLYTDGVFECYTLEPPLTGNGVVAIPEGIFPVILAWSKHFQKVVPHLLNVPGRQYIEIHWGNYVTNTLGCILVGEIKDKDSILKSVLAFDALFDKIKAALDRQDSITIEITNTKETL